MRRITNIEQAEFFKIAKHEGFEESDFIIGPEARNTEVLRLTYVHEGFYFEFVKQGSNLYGITFRDIHFKTISHRKLTKVGTISYFTQWLRQVKKEITTHPGWPKDEEFFTNPRDKEELSEEYIKAFEIRLKEFEKRLLEKLSENGREVSSEEVKEIKEQLDSVLKEAKRKGSTRSTLKKILDKALGYLTMRLLMPQETIDEVREIAIETFKEVVTLIEGM